MADPVVDPEVTAEAVELPDLKTRVQWVDDWDEATLEARKLATRDRQYYDNQQWTKEEIDALKERKQPVLTKNRIARKINYILGEEIRKRVNPVGRPRTPQHEDGSRAATDALRYVADEQRFDKARSAVLKNALIEGYGGAIKGVEDAGDGEFKHTLAHVEWDRLFYDPHSRAVDFADAKYLGVMLWMDLDDALSDYPDAGDALRAAVEKGRNAPSESGEDAPRGWVDGKRKRVKICEMYHRIGDDWYRSVFTESADVEETERTAYLDEKKKRSVCPLKMVSCYVDKEGNRYGVVRQLISPQDEINKRSSKALHLLSVRQVIAERDAVRDPVKFQEELAKPDGYAETEPGALQENRVQTTQTGDLAAGQVQLLQQANQDIDNVGPSSSMMADMPNSMSGRAFQARAQSASQELGTIFDQLREWSLSVFAIDWLCVRQFWSREKWLRVTDDQEETGYRFVALNQATTRAARFQELVKKGVPAPSALQTSAGEFAPIVMRDVEQMAQQQAQQIQQAAAQAQALGMQPPPPAPPADPTTMIPQHPLMLQPITLNQVDQMLVDIVIDEAPDTAILAQEEFDTLGELMPVIVQARPDMGPSLAKMMIKASQLPNKRDLLKDLDKGPDPQVQQEQEQAKKIQQAMAQAEIGVKSSRAQLQQAQAQKTATEAGLEPQKAQSKAQLEQAQALNHAASAGEKTAMPGTQSEVLL